MSTETMEREETETINRVATCQYDGEPAKNPIYIYVSTTRQAAFHDMDCLISWWGDANNTHRSRLVGKLPRGYTPNFTLTSDIDEQEPQKKRRVTLPAGADKKEGDPPYAQGKKEGDISTAPYLFTLDDLRSMTWWQPLYKAVKQILGERGHWKELARGGSFKSGNPYRFSEKKEG